MTCPDLVPIILKRVKKDTFEDVLIEYGLRSSQNHLSINDNIA